MNHVVATCPAILRERRGRRAVVVGGGRTGAAAARLLLREGAASVVVVDDAATDAVVSGLEKYGVDVAGVSVVGGGISADVVNGADVVVLSPGVPRAHPALQMAIAKDIVVNELELGLAVLTNNGEHLSAIRLWAITGTNGKSTTTTMAGAIAKRVDQDAFVGGNLGLPLSQAVVDGLSLGTPEAPRLLVVELSSYQLETLRFFPATAAAVTNLSPDHLDRYPNVDGYYAAKARLIGLAQGPVSLNASDAESQRVLSPSLTSTKAFHFDIPAGVEAGVTISSDAPSSLRLTIKRRGAGDVVVAVDNAAIVGHHNRQNAAAAAALAAADGDVDAIGPGLSDYAGIAHRLERVGERAGVTWWNDSKATNVDAAVIAVKSFAGGVHLIAGGLGKGSSYQPLVEVSVGRVVAVYTIGADAAVIAAAFAAHSSISVVDAKTLDVAAGLAAKAAKAGEHIVLSPACASFDQFRDYTHRGASFRAAFDASGSAS